MSGNKTMGDPDSEEFGMSAYRAGILNAGFNLVSIDYALAPEYRYPTPVIQVDQAIDFLIKKQEEYGLDMSNVVLNGASAGGNIAAQYANIVTNKEYAQTMRMEPALKSENLKAIVLDNAIYDGNRSGNVSENKFSFLFYLCKFAYLDWRSEKDDVRENNIFLHTTKNFPPCYIVDGNEGTFDDQAREFDELLTSLNVVHKANIIPRNVAKLGHAFLLDDTPYAREDIRMKMEFLRGVLKMD